MSLFKKKKVPDELPDLAMDELEKELKTEKVEVSQPIKSVIRKSYSEKNLEFKPVYNPVFPSKEIESPSKEISEEVVSEKSFFADLEKNINKEILNIDGLDRWYDRKFMPQDIISDMRSYWDKQNSVFAMKVFGRNFKEKINEKITHLQDLERQWQNIYFDLIEKEEELREEEKELKKLLAEFVELCKKKKQEINNKRK